MQEDEAEEMQSRGEEGGCRSNGGEQDEDLEEELNGKDDEEDFEEQAFADIDYEQHEIMYEYESG